MSKLVVFKLGNGDFQNGFPCVTVQLWDDNPNILPTQYAASLPPSPELLELCKRWQILYKLLPQSIYTSLDWHRLINIGKSINIGDIEIEADENYVTNVSIVEFSYLCVELQKKVNAWLKSEQFRYVEQKLRTRLLPSDEIKVILETESDQARRLPWHLWDFFEDYQKAILALSTPEFEQSQPLPNFSRNKVRILAILGSSEGINIQKDREILEKLPYAETVFIVEPQRRELDQLLWDKKGWDILFFAGHGSSQLDGEKGRIYINKTDSLTVIELKNSLKAAIARGLRLAVFNCCDGLGLAYELASLHIPQMIVMRESVPDLVAQEFLKHFLETYADGESFYTAVRQAGDKLQGLEYDFPCASWLPIICQSPFQTPLAWFNPKKKWQRFLKHRHLLPQIINTTVAVTALIVGIQALRVLLLYEFITLDALVRSRSDEKRSERIVLVNPNRTKALSFIEKRGVYVAERNLAQELEKLEQLQSCNADLGVRCETLNATKYEQLAAVIRHIFSETPSEETPFVWERRDCEKVQRK
jgi:CHAT domain